MKKAEEIMFSFRVNIAENELDWRKRNLKEKKNQIPQSGKYKISQIIFNILLNPTFHLGTTLILQILLIIKSLNYKAIS